MKKRRLACLLLAAIIVSLAAGLWLWPSGEPVYQGKKISEWLEGSHDGIAYTNSVLAVRAIGTNAIPWLLHELDAKDSWLKQKMVLITSQQEVLKISIRTEMVSLTMAMEGFRMLGPQATVAIPELVKRLHRPESTGKARLIFLAMVRAYPARDDIETAEALAPLRREVLAVAINAITNHDAIVRTCGARLVVEAGFDEPSAVLALIHRLQDPDVGVRIVSAQGLGRRTGLPVAAIPPLIAALTDPDNSVRSCAADSLGSYYRQAKTAVPALLKARADPSSDVRLAVGLALDKIDPETAAAIPDLPDFKPLPPAPQPKD